MNQEEKNKTIRFQSEMLIKYINFTTEMICNEEPPKAEIEYAEYNEEPQKAVIVNREELDRIANSKPIEEKELDNLQKCGVAVKKLKVNDIITKEVNDVYKNGDIMRMLNLINIYNKKVRYDEDGIATNLEEVLKEIRGGGCE